MRVNKKNKKKVIIAVILGGVAAISIFNSMNSQKAQMNQLLAEQQAAIQNLAQQQGTQSQEQQAVEAEILSAVIAANNIKVGDTYMVEDLEVAEFNPDVLPEGYFKTSALVVGKKAKKNIVKGQFITTSDIQAEDVATIEIPSGMRAVSIPAEKFTGLASHLRVGSTVDLLKVSQSPEYIVQNVRIVSFETQASETTSRYDAKGDVTVNPQYLTATQASAITFLVPWENVSNVINQVEEGKVQIIARNSNDEKLIITENELPPPPGGSHGIELSAPDLPSTPLEEKEKFELEIAELPEPEEKIIELIKASDRSTIEFDADMVIMSEEENDESESLSSLSELKNLKELLDLVE